MTLPCGANKLPPDTVTLAPRPTRIAAPSSGASTIDWASSTLEPDTSTPYQPSRTGPKPPGPKPPGTAPPGTAPPGTAPPGTPPPAGASPRRIVARCRCTTAPCMAATPAARPPVMCPPSSVSSLAPNTDTAAGAPLAGTAVTLVSRSTTRLGGRSSGCNDCRAPICKPPSTMALRWTVTLAPRSICTPPAPCRVLSAMLAWACSPAT
ncbi:Uncharacterised protein [Bordetella pertussis]|nr:Uncharacterised protein [Bordetella pertussis]CPN61121.1 Uncharacterised protein [Bordetella pertussis]